MAFACSICEQESVRICVSCTKDACDNHICESCGCCSDCCNCDVPLTEPATPVAATMIEPPMLQEPAAEPEVFAVAASETGGGPEFAVAAASVPAAEPEAFTVPGGGVAFAVVAASGPDGGPEFAFAPAVVPASELEAFVVPASQPGGAALAAAPASAPAEPSYAAGAAPQPHAPAPTDQSDSAPGDFTPESLNTSEV